MGGSITEVTVFAKQIICLAAEQKMTVHEFHQAMFIADEIVQNSTVDVQSITKAPYPILNIMEQK